jgi:ABC-type transporter Mla MlaB component
MLKITSQANDGSLLVRLEGKLVGPWVNEARVQLDRTVANRSAIRLDLAKLSFVDRAGTSLLHDLVSRGFAIESCSNYVAELLELERNG